MELKLITNLEALPAELDFNFEELKAELSAQLEKYRGLIVTEDTIKDGKDDRVKLNKLKTAIDTRRKEIKKQWSEPYNVFEGKIKEVLALIDQPIAAIDSQLNAYEEKRKAEKQEQIEGIYHETVPADIKGLLLLERIADPRWLNKSVSPETIKQDIAGLVTRTQNDLLALKEVEAEHAAAVRTEYYRTRDLGAAMRLLTELRAAAAAIKAETPTENPPEPPKPQKAAQEPQRAPETQNAQAGETLYNLCLSLILTKQQAAGLKQYLIDNNIKYQQI